MGKDESRASEEYDKSHEGRTGRSWKTEAAPSRRRVQEAVRGIPVVDVSEGGSPVRGSLVVHADDALSSRFGNGGAVTIKHSLDDPVRPAVSWAFRLRLGRWPGFTVAAWGFLFAVPSFVWALGGTLGVQATVAPPLVKLAHDRVTWFLAVLWVTGFLKLFGALVGIGLTRRRGKRTGRLMVLCGGGATVLLVWHGCQFVTHGVLVEAGARAVAPDLAGLTRWYLYLWGPWFIAGGLAFATAATQYVRRHDDRREVRVYGCVGAFGALFLSLASLVAGIG